MSYVVFLLLILSPALQRLTGRQLGKDGHRLRVLRTVDMRKRTSQAKLLKMTHTQSKGYVPPVDASYAPEITLQRVYPFRFRERIASEGGTYPFNL